MTKSFFQSSAERSDAPLKDDVDRDDRRGGFLRASRLLKGTFVEAATQAEAERKLRTVLETSDANLGFLDNAPIVVPVAIEGDLDLVDAKEAAQPQRGSRRRPAPANERR
jgi:hypothetical protein